MAQTRLGALNVSLDLITLSGLNPRLDMDKDALKELAQSIREVGIIEPLVVRKNGAKGRYELVAGHRRLKAAQMAGLALVPVIVHDIADEQMTEIMVLENLQREDLSPIEEAVAISGLLKAGRSEKDIAKTLGKCEKWVVDRFKLLHLPDGIKTALAEKRMNVSATVPLFQFLPSPGLMNRVSNELMKQAVERDYDGNDAETKINDTLVLETLEKFVNSYSLNLSDLDNDYGWYPHFDGKDCKKCKEPIVHTTRWGEKVKRCLKKTCFQPKISKAKQLLKEEESKPHGEKKKSGKHIRDFPGAFHLDDNADFNTAVCQDCILKTVVKNWSDEDLPICLKPSCAEKMDKAAREILSTQHEEFRKVVEKKFDSFVKDYKPVGLDPSVSMTLLKIFDDDDEEKLPKKPTSDFLEVEAVKRLMKRFVDYRDDGPLREIPLFKDIPWNDEKPTIEPERDLEYKQPNKKEKVGKWRITIENDCLTCAKEFGNGATQITPLESKKEIIAKAVDYIVGQLDEEDSILERRTSIYKESLILDNEIKKFSDITLDFLWQKAMEKINGGMAVDEDDEPEVAGEEA